MVLFSDFKNKLHRPVRYLGRPTYISADLCFTTDFSLFLFLLISFFAAVFPSPLNGSQPKFATCSEVSAMRIEDPPGGHRVPQNGCPKPGVSPFPTNWEPQNHLFGRLGNLTANLTAYIFGTKHDVDNRASALTTTKGLLRRLKTT